MEITTLAREETRLDLSVRGRLDVYWADHLAEHLEEAVRGGARHVNVRLADVTYISSMGIRVLVDYYKKLAAIQGSFTIVSPSPQVEKILAMTGLLEHLLAPIAPARVAGQGGSARVDRPDATFDVAILDAAASFRCRAVGDPSALTKEAYAARSCRGIAFSESTIGVGLGALGNGFEDSRNRFGEFLAAAGSAAYQPTDGSNVPDYIGSAEKLVPEVQVLYALACEGKFSHLLRFAAKDDPGSLRMSDLLKHCLELSGSKRAAVVLVAESTGLLGAWLRKSPAATESHADLYAYPAIRKWLAFAPDRVHARALTLVVGVVAESPDGAIAEFVRPVGAQLHGHLHAAAFSYQPLMSGPLNLQETVRSLFATERLHGVLHLLCDDRGSTGAGESEFVRGAAWIGPITEMVREEASA